MIDKFTMDARMCDNDGLVSNNPIDPKPSLAREGLTYIELMNSWIARTRRAHGEKYERVEPFSCTGSAHLLGEHIRCTSPAHMMNVTAPQNCTCHATRPSTQVWHEANCRCSPYFHDGSAIVITDPTSVARILEIVRKRHDH